MSKKHFWKQNVKEIKDNRSTAQQRWRKNTDLPSLQTTINSSHYQFRNQGTFLLYIGKDNVIFNCLYIRKSIIGYGDTSHIRKNRRYKIKKVVLKNVLWASFLSTSDKILQIKQMRPPSLPLHTICLPFLLPGICKTEIAMVIAIPLSIHFSSDSEFVCY